MSVVKVPFKILLNNFLEFAVAVQMLMNTLSISPARWFFNKLINISKYLKFARDVRKIILLVRSHVIKYRLV